jgi:multisubunit Na+/H+ antiporter MnhC subunit
MALTKCPECATEVSDVAYKCPKCGFALRTAKRSLFGKIIKYSFIAFNVLMLIWLIGGVGGAASGTEVMTDAEKTGTAIGAGIGAMLILTIWVIGDLILGLFVLFTRPKAG